MKLFLLFCLLFSTVASAQAQLVNLLSTGVRVGVQAGLNHSRKNRAGEADANAAPATDVNVTPAYYRSQPYPQKRTPAAKLKGPGGDQIAYQETLLQKCQAAMLADSTTIIGTPDVWATLKGSVEVISRYRPTWNTQAYTDEAAFYQAEAARRQRVAPSAAAH